MNESTLSYDAVVIGAGVIGAATAFELARRGLRVGCVDKAPVAGAGSTVNSCAIVRFSYSSVPGIRMAWEGLHYWTNWAEYLGVEDELGLIEFHQCGHLMLFTDDTAHSLRVRDLWLEMGIPFEELTVQEIEERYPLIDHGLYGPPKRPDDPHFWDDAHGKITGAMFAPDGGYVSDPQLSVHNLQRAAEAHGAEFHFNVEVADIAQADGRTAGVVLADGRTIGAPIVVNVAGPHSYLINQMAGVYDSMNIKTKALRHEVHHVPSPRDFDFEARGAVTGDDDTGIYFRPEPGNNILIGSADPVCDVREWVDPDDYNTQITQSQYEAQVLRANRRIKDLGVPHDRKGIVDLYDVSDDWIPIYDRTDLDGFYVAIGTSGNQYKNAGVAGHVMAELITAVESGRDHDRDPIVVPGRYTGLEMDIGFFSRNREISPDSSMSVHG